jgi:hypothetical protein
VHINWAAFGEVFVVSFGVALGLIVLFAIGVSLLSSPAPDPDGSHLALAAAEGATTPATPAPSRAPLARRVTAWGCFLACGLSVAYGLSIIIAR